MNYEGENPRYLLIAYGRFGEFWVYANIYVRNRECAD